MSTTGTTTTSTPGRVGRRQLSQIADQLDTIDRQLLTLLATHHYATTGQLAQIVNTTGRWATLRSALRQTTRRLGRHRRLGLVEHLQRRIGGVRAGSTGYVWYLREPGWRLAAPQQATRHRHSEPSRTFLAHTLAVTEARLVIERAAHAAGGHLSLLRTEPDCWRSWSGLGGARHWLRPDLEAITTTKDGEQDHWLLEVDLATENPARLLTKCHQYQAHLDTGAQQAQDGYYPQVVWLLNDPQRAAHLDTQIRADPRLTPGLFVIAASAEQLISLIQQSP